MPKKARPSIPSRPAPLRYSNTVAREALEALVATPSIEAVDVLFAAAKAEDLVIDVTGSPRGGEPRIRTITSTDGALVLPLFTSTDELRLAVPRQQQPILQGLVLPGSDALRLIETADFVAVQFDPGSLAQVITRSFVENTLATEES